MEPIRKWCDSCGEMTDWIDGECANYLVLIAAKQSYIMEQSKKEIKEKFDLWYYENGITPLTDDEFEYVVDFFFKIIEPLEKENQLPISQETARLESELSSLKEQLKGYEEMINELETQDIKVSAWRYLKSTQP